jgi:hypothetical protein
MIWKGERGLEVYVDVESRRESDVEGHMLGQVIAPTLSTPHFLA